jgi:hypothetical protein
MESRSNAPEKDPELVVEGAALPVGVALGAAQHAGPQPGRPPVPPHTVHGAEEPPEPHRDRNDGQGDQILPQDVHAFTVVRMP